MNEIFIKELCERINRLEEKIENNEFQRRILNGLNCKLKGKCEEIENMKAWRNKINGALVLINVLLLPLLIGFIIEYILK